MTSYDDQNIWQDRSVIFDAKKNELNLSKGEESYESMSMIENVKGDGEIGSFLFTNLRLIWYNNKNPKINLSIGYDCISEINNVYTDTKLTGQSDVLVMKCRTEKSIHELIFRNISENKQNLYNSISNILKLYEAGRFYRDLKLNNNLKNANSEDFEKLLDENILLEKHGIALISENDNKKNFGTLYKTNIRLIWINDKFPNYNISFPWIQILEIKEEQNRQYGFCFRVNAKRFYNGCSFIFTGDISNELINGLNDCLNKSNENPVLSVNVQEYLKGPKKTDGGKKVDKLKDKFNKIVDKVFGNEKEVEDKGYTQSGVIYLINETRNKNCTINDIVFNVDLGIAAEKLPEGIKIEDLWKITK